MLSKVDRQTGDLTTVAGTPASAIQVAYDNATSGLSASNVQGAIDEVIGKAQYVAELTNDTGSELWMKLATNFGALGTDTFTFLVTAGKNEVYNLQLSAVVDKTSGSAGPMAVGVRRVTDAWNQYGQDYDSFAISQFVYYNQNVYIRVIHNTKVRITQQTGNAINPLNLSFVICESGDVPGAGAYYVPLNSENPSFDFLTEVRKKNFAKMGEQYNWAPGFLRQGRKPRKVIVIGNSMTYHGYMDYWQVNDLREMAASTPTSGWVHLVYQRLKELNPNIEMYKANGATWETATLGSRAYSNLSANPVAKMTDTGCELTSLTVNDVLDSGVDIIICQLYENIGSIAYTQVGDMVTDYRNLYKAFQQKCPNAFLYQFCGFWQDYYKHLSVINACFDEGVEPIYAPTLNPYNTGLGRSYTEMVHSVYECKEGDNIYDGEGNVITTVSSNVAGHPNDFGFKVMAAHVLCHLYNQYGMGDSGKMYPQFVFLSSTNIDELLEAGELFMGGLYAKTSSGEEPDKLLQLTHNLYDRVFNYFIFNGIYNCCVNYVDSANHGYMVTETTQVGGYSRVNQKFIDNNVSFRTFTRGVILSADMTSFTDWVPNFEYISSADAHTYFLPTYAGGNMLRRKIIRISTSGTIGPTTWTPATALGSSATWEAVPTCIVNVTLLQQTNDYSNAKTSDAIRISGFMSVGDVVNLARDSDATLNVDSLIIIDYAIA